MADFVVNFQKIFFFKYIFALGERVDASIIIIVRSLLQKEKIRDSPALGVGTVIDIIV